MSKIEIIIPVYNGRATLGRTLASLEAQTCTEFAVHIVDDCSTETYDDIVGKYNSLNTRITRNEENVGCGMSRQVGIDSTNADYIAFLDADDVLMPYTVEMWHKAIYDVPNADIFHSHFLEETETVLKLKKDGFTFCHGKLYKVSFIRKYNIRNSREIKYMDDSFFNSMCTELGNVAVIGMPMYIWMNNRDSITRNGKMTSDACRYDFIHGIILSTQFVRSKGVKTIKHMEGTLKILESIKHEFSEKTLNEYNRLLKLIT